MGGICGKLLPTENYQLIREDVQEWNVSLDRDYSKWRSYNFNVQLENGYFVLPQGGYEINDFKEFPDEPLEVRTAGIHSHIFEDYFVHNKPFVIAPWTKINIEEKFELEEKYENETSFDRKQALSFSQDPRWNPIFSALAVNKLTQQVLFATSYTKIGCFSIIDFVNKDEQGNPLFEFYDWFDEVFIKQ